MSYPPAQGKLPVEPSARGPIVVDFSFRDGSKNRAAEEMPEGCYPDADQREVLKLGKITWLK
jgi:hypothetical protein